MQENQAEKTRSEIDGRQAWLTLSCIFIINAITLGSLKIYGIIFAEIVTQNYYDREEASWPISTASTIQNLAGFLTPLLALKISWRSIEALHAILLISANVGAYFSSNLVLDILWLGIVQGIALSMRYNMNIAINNEYFSKYRTTAMGVSLAGSTCGVFFLKPIISLVLDRSRPDFRNAYLALATLSCINLMVGCFIRKPKSLDEGTNENCDPNETSRLRNDPEPIPISRSLITLIKNPNIHCIWIMQTIYFYSSRTYTIFIVDYGQDKGFSVSESRDLLDFWVYGEVGGRLLLGTLIDLRLLSVKWNIIVVNSILSIGGFFLLFKPTMLPEAVSQHVLLSSYLWIFGLLVFLQAALSSLVNMLIIPFGQEYLGKKNVPWAYATSSVITSLFLLVRPAVIGWSRDELKSYDPLIIVMSSQPCIFAFLFLIFEPILRRWRFIDTSSSE